MQCRFRFSKQFYRIQQRNNFAPDLSDWDYRGWGASSNSAHGNPIPTKKFRVARTRPKRPRTTTVGNRSEMSAQGLGSQVVRDAGSGLWYPKTGSPKTERGAGEDQGGVLTVDDPPLPATCYCWWTLPRSPRWPFWAIWQRVRWHSSQKREKRERKERY